MALAAIVGVVLSLTFWMLGKIGLINKET